MVLDYRETQHAPCPSVVVLRHEYTKVQLSQGNHANGCVLVRPRVGSDQNRCVQQYRQGLGSPWVNDLSAELL